MINIKRIKEVSLLQHDSTDCGAACLASVIRYYGGNSGIDKIRRLSGTTQSGTTMLGLYQAALECGLEVTGYEASVTDIMEFPGVLILHVTPEKCYEHYIVCFGYTEGRFIIWDPASGFSERTAPEIDLIWVSHKCLSVSPGKDFQFESEKNNVKRKWLIDTIRPEKDLLLASVFIGVLIAVLGVVMAVFTQKLLDRILPSGETRLLIVAAILVFLLLGFRVIFTSIRQYILLSQGKTYNIRVVDGFYRSLLGLSIPFFDTRKTGDMVARLNDTMRIQRVISDIVSTYIIDVLVILITASMIFFYSTTAGIISIIAVPIFFLLVSRWKRPIVEAQQDLMAGYSLNESNFINTLRGIKEIKCMEWQRFYEERNRSVFTMFQERAFSLGKIKVKLGMLTNLTGILYLIGLLVYTSFEVMGTRMTKGELMAIISLSSTLLPSILNLALVSIPFSEAKVAIERMFEFTQLKPENDRENDLPGNYGIDLVTLDGISFRFPGQKLFLEGINLEIVKGRITALVGESGSGKSTLASIIMRFYHPESGHMKVNGYIDSYEIPLSIWRRSIGLIPQEIHIFNGTILENIIPDADHTKLKRLGSITTEYGLEAFIKSLPHGFATITGEEGVKLSGGQKQVIGFMRALINDPDLLLIDEGTSGMDRDTEAIIVNILKRIKSTIGILLITHRLNLIKRICDTVYILEDRTTSPIGTYHELISGDNQIQ